MKKITYNIATPQGTVQAIGYLLDYSVVCGDTTLTFAVRNTKQGWKVDNIQTGFGLFYFHRTRQSAVDFAIRRLERQSESQTCDAFGRMPKNDR